MSGDVRLSDEGGTATRLVAALAALTARVTPGTFALIGGLAVMTRLGQVHRATDDIDGVSEQVGDSPSDVAIVLGEAGRAGSGHPIEGVKIDHIDVGDTPAADIPAVDLPASEWDRAFVLAHRWGLDSATPATIAAVRARSVVASVTCLVASPASLVTMKLQSAPPRPPARAHKAANDYLDLFRFISNDELAPAIAADLLDRAPHDLGTWAIERIRLELSERADNAARTMRRGAPTTRVGPDEIAAAAMAFLSRARTPALQGEPVTHPHAGAARTRRRRP